VYKKKHSTLAVKKREQVKDAAAYVFVAFKDSNADASEKVLKDLETQINGLLDSNEMEIFEVFNSLPQGEQVMKAIGLLLLEKENLLTIFNHFSHKEVEKSEDPQVNFISISIYFMYLFSIKIYYNYRDFLEDQMFVVEYFVLS